MSSHREANTARPPQGRYSNYFEVGLNQEELVIDFGQAYGEQESIGFHTRIVTSPGYAKDLAELLEKSLQQYERDYGTLRAGRASTPSTDAASAEGTTPAAAGEGSLTGNS